VVTVIKPSREATNRIYQKVAKIVDETLGYRREKRKGASPEELLIIRLNPVIGGWVNYFRYSNAKKSFNRLDHILWWKLWKAMRRRHKGKSRYKTVETYFKKPGGKWQFCCPTDSDREEKKLRSFDETPIVQYYQIEKSRRYYDGDRAYWGTKLGRYPTLPARLGKLLKKQHGKCHTCRNKISPVTTRSKSGQLRVTRGARSWRGNALTHLNCDNHFATLEWLGGNTSH
jgi:RNA-directed DNA polymerase